LWLHLSPDDHLVALVDESRVDHASGLIGLRVPEQSFRENREPCLCVAKLLWQCVVSIPKDGKLWVYRVDSVEAEPAPSSVADRGMTDEYEITAAILERRGGRIPLSRDGFVVIDASLRTDVKVLMQQGRVPRDAAAERGLWERDEDSWHLRRGLPGAVR